MSETSVTSRRLVAKMVVATCLAVLQAGGGTISAEAQPMQGNAERNADSMRIRITVESREVTAMLDKTPSGRAFAAMLPLTLTLSDYGGGIEKISDLPAKLPTDGAPAGLEPVRGDITYYAPWGNLAIFREGYSYAGGLVRLGTITGGFEALDRSGPLRVTIVLADE